MKSLKNILLILIVIVVVVSGGLFLTTNIFNNAKVQETDISHEGGGGSSIRNWHFSFTTPDFEKWWNTATEVISEEAEDIRETIDHYAEEQGSEAESLAEPDKALHRKEEKIDFKEEKQ